MKQINLQKKNHLETEKLDFLKTSTAFISNINFSDYEHQSTTGRPKFPIEDILKSLLIMNYHSWSYRRSRSDLEILKNLGFLNNIPKRSTMNKYMQEPILKVILTRLIEMSATTFIPIEDCIMLDSSQFFNKILMGGSKSKCHHKSKLFQVPTLEKTRKLHVAIARESKMIICARTSKGTVHDYNFCIELIDESIKNGFNVKTVLADAAYNSKEAYSFCEDKGIVAYLDFKSNSIVRRSNSALRRRQLIMYKENKEEWHNAYRYRVLVESVFSVIKKKGLNHLRSRNENAKDCEMLLKSLWYNLCILAKEHEDFL